MQDSTLKHVSRRFDSAIDEKKGQILYFLIPVECFITAK